MHLQHILGSTFAVDASTALIPIYKLGDRDVVLLDTGYAASDRDDLLRFLRESRLNVKGIICSHAHYDHVGNVSCLKRLFGCSAAIQLIEAAIVINPDTYRANYILTTPDGEGYPEECFTPDVIISPKAESLEFCGATFGIMQLPGHSAGHIAIGTPDGVFYLGDAIISGDMMADSKMLTTQFVGRDLESKERLRKLRAPMYILAHKLVCTDISGLIDPNIRHLTDKALEVLDCLKDGMTIDEWTAAFRERAGIHIRSDIKFIILEYGFSHFVDYLLEKEKAAAGRVDGIRRFYHL